MVSALEFGWPLIIAVVIVAGLRWRASVLLALGYATVAVVAGSAGTVLGLTMVLVGWGTNALIPVLFVLPMSARPVRAVAPLLAPSAIVTGIALSGSAGLALWLGDSGLSPVGAVILALAAVALVAAAGLLIIPLMAARYRRKAASDQSILLDQWWLLFFLVHVALNLNRGAIGMAMLLPYLGYRVVIGVGRRLAGREAGRDRAVQLLLLRVFGARGRSQWLLRDLSVRWRHVGSVEMIAGTDLATETLQPHDVLDFLLRRLSRRFITGPQALRDRLAALDLRPDADGRFRVNEFRCHEDTWRPTLHALAGIADVVLIDLRGLAPDRAGVAYEINQLTALGLLDRVVALVDRSTDVPFLQYTLDSAGAAGLHLVEVAGRAEPAELLDRLERVMIPAPATGAPVR